MRTVLVAALLLTLGLVAPAADFHAGFDEPETSWTARFDPAALKKVQHRRHRHLTVKGAGSEYLLFEAGRSGGTATLELPIPATRVIDEFALTLNLRSNRTGIALGLRVVLPQEKDPATGEPLSIIIPGDVYSTPQKWQVLKATTLERQVRERIVLLRARLNNPNLDLTNLSVNRVVLLADLAPGQTEIIIDELKCGPMVATTGEIRGAANEAEASALKPIAEMQLDRLTVDGKPFFPRLVAWHDEPLESLRDAGVNLVWIPSEAEPATLQKLQELGLWAAATPPQVTGDDGLPLKAREAAMVPFPDSTSPILIWNLGTRIPPSAKDEIQNWIDQIRTADRRLKRPIMLDVSGNEKVYSRLAPMLGTSRHVVHTTFSFKDYRNWLAQRRKLSRSGSFLWTWVQTEAAPAHIDWRAAGVHAPVVVEPEQIRLQTYAALASGCRGVGFWKTSPLAGAVTEGEDEAMPGDQERRLILTQLNYELELIGPALATGSVVTHQPFEVKPQKIPKPSQRALDNMGKAEQDALLRAYDDDLRRLDLIKDELEATILATEFGTLVLPVWYEKDSQFVPGQLAANDATIVVPGANQSAAAWEVSTTGIRSLNKELGPGGLRIQLPKFDQTAIILVTANREVVAQLRDRIALMAPRSAETIKALARAKYDRVVRVNEELQQLGMVQHDAAKLLSRAGTLLNEAEQAFASQDFRACRDAAENSMQLVRVLQRGHWNDAVRNLSSPLSSPHTISFQTLPSHWKMISQIGRSSLNDTNLLRSGDFEDRDTMFVEGWRNSQRSPEGVRTLAELFPAAQQGKYSLRMLAEMRKPAEKPVEEEVVDQKKAKPDPPPAVLNDAPVIVSTPQITVRSGQILHISGWIRVVTPPTSTLDGVMVYDTLLGTAGAVRWNRTNGWQRFEILREVRESGPIKVQLALTGLGEVQFDDLRVVPHAPRSESEPPAELATEPARGALPFLKGLSRLPRFGPQRNGYAPQPPSAASASPDSPPEPPRIGSAPEETRRN
jgi:hypothetical protein